MASKGKGKEKTKSPPPPADGESNTDKEVVPGKLSEKAWFKLLNRAEGNEIATEVVNEVFEVAFSIVHSHYLEKQAFPHAISDAKHSLLQIIEWQFLSRDEGEKDTINDPSWIEDEEAVPATIDSWARGLVPSNSLSTLDTSIESIGPVRVHSSLQPVVEKLVVSEDQTSSELRGSTVSSARKSAPKKKVHSRARPIARHSQARLVALSQPPTVTTDGRITESTNRDPDDTATPSPHPHTPTSFTADPLHLPIPLPYGMKPIQLTWQKEVTYDERGIIVDMVRLDPTRFPKHSVKPSVTVVKPLQSHAKRTPHKAVEQPQPLSLKRGALSKRGVESTGVRQSRRFPELLTLPALVDTIDPVCGVTVREAGRTVSGPKAHKSLTGPAANTAQNLCPVHPHNVHVGQT